VIRMQGLTHALCPDGGEQRNGDQVRGGNGAKGMQQKERRLRASIMHTAQRQHCQKNMGVAESICNKTKR
jgi:hypothetical protein